MRAEIPSFSPTTVLTAMPGAAMTACSMPDEERTASARTSARGWIAPCEDGEIATRLFRVGSVARARDFHQEADGHSHRIGTQAGKILH